MAFDRITVNPNVCGGKPTVRGLRITVDFVLKLLGDGYTAEQIVGEYPELSSTMCIRRLSTAPGWPVRERPLCNEASCRFAHLSSHR